MVEIKRLYFRKIHWQEMLDHVERCVPQEACGLLAGKHSHVGAVLPVLNQAQSPVRFVMEPREQLRAFDWIQSQGLELLGIFHSHPTGPDTASATDITQAAYEVVHVICAPKNGHWHARGFWIEGNRATEVQLKMVE